MSLIIATVHYEITTAFLYFPTCGVMFLSCPTEPGTFVFPEEKIKLLIKYYEFRLVLIGPVGL